MSEKFSDEMVLTNGETCQQGTDVLNFAKGWRLRVFVNLAILQTTHKNGLRRFVSVHKPTLKHVKKLALCRSATFSSRNLSHKCGLHGVYRCQRQISPPMVFPQPDVHVIAFEMLLYSTLLHHTGCSQSLVLQ